MSEKNYQALINNQIFMCGAADVAEIVKNENIDVVVDLRGEATECADPNSKVEWVQIPLGDNAVEPQELLFKQAVGEVIKAYQEGKKVAFHCNGGRGRTGAVAAGVLIELGQANNIDEAEAKAQSIRSILNIKPAQRESLSKLYPNGYNRD